MKQSTKILSLALCVTSLALIFNTYTINAAAETLTSGDGYDEALLNLIEETANENFEESVLSISAEKEIIYDLNLHTLGYLYHLHVNHTDGYALVINTDGYPEVTELFYDSVNPYNEISYAKIYLKQFVYAYYDGNYYWSDTQTEITEEEMTVLTESSYCSTDYVQSSSSETINYILRNEEKYSMVARHPACTSISGYPNDCAAVAGANIVQFYDRMKENLIPSYTSYTVLSNKYFYKALGAETTSVIQQLYTNMNTNTSNPGVTISQFKQGLKTYCNGKGYDIQYNSCMNGAIFNFTNAKNYIENGKPIVVFVDTFAIVANTDNGNSEVVDYFNYNAAHVMVGFGYKTITYTLSNGTRSDNYLQVASGLQDRKNGYYSISKNTTIDDAYAVNIV